ncbi:MAG: hypothetical protein HY281_12490 [Nitrospirae bacterium]|nr:hypothetical protein [Nitrospirota bacterium]
MKRMWFEVHGDHLFSRHLHMVRYGFLSSLALTVSPALVVVTPISRITA